ncbi:hypothetical protein Vadar_016360 [Vaccinium darrowii]|uniref:Uncharacterized protein n=1 Tax=Vaccinium darrowii TaxID=229202 RepID=A0ACB7X1B2_9ERIC|nr:hypothetical protein Vadar_016360 [Vaccinium darrowii]
MERSAEEKEKEPEWINVHSDLLAKEDASADLEWISGENLPPESHQFFAPASLSAPEDHLPSLSENNPFHLSQPEINPCYPANSSFSNSLYDTNLEAYFSRLCLEPYDQNPSFRSSNNLDFSSPQIRPADLMGMRVQSAERGQTGLNFDHQNVIQENLLEDIGLDNFNYLIHGGQNRYPALNRDGSKFLWEKIMEKKPEDVEMVFSEVRDRACELMVDRIGNDFIRKFFQVCDQQQITQMLLVVLSDTNLMAVCCDSYGTRATQKLLERITTKEQICLVVAALLPIVVNLTKNLYGCHVIRDCVLSFSSEDNRLIFHVVAVNCVGIGVDKHGCRVLQKCLDYAQGESKEFLMAEIAANALVLSESQYGNYVVQCMLEMRIPHVTAAVLERLAGNYVSLSMNKYGSNVVETCLKSSGEDEVEQIISEMVTDPNFLGVLQDPYGNYVAQSALEKAKGRLRHTMVNRIQMHYPYLQNHPYGKRVLTTTKSRATNHHRR